MTIVKKHYRRVGRKKVLVRRHSRRPPRIKDSERKLFNHLSDPKNYKKEYGGHIDFSHGGKIEEIEVIPGTKYTVDLYDDDFEVLYHTHPTSKPSPPSIEDIMALIRSKNQQAELIFKNGEAFAIVKTPNSKPIEKMKHKDAEKLVEAFWDPEDEDKVARNLEKLGFLVHRSRKNTKPIILKGVKVKD